MIREDAAFTDTGCELHPACLSCPRIICVLDEPEEPHENLSSKIARLLGEGNSCREVGNRLGVSKRTVLRHKKEMAV